MKKLLSIVSLLLFVNPVFAAVNPDAKEVAVGISGVFVPGGFDSSSDAYVVVSGVFQNGCYKWSRAERTSRDEFNHEIKSMATVTPGMCIMVLVPFQKEVRLGRLSSGQHNLRFVNGDGTYLEKTLIVE